MAREQGAVHVPFTPELTPEDEWLVRSSQNVTDSTVAAIVDQMTGREIREARARLAAEKVRLEQMANVTQSTLSQITDALRARE